MRYWNLFFVGMGRRTGELWTFLSRYRAIYFACCHLLVESKFGKCQAVTVEDGDETGVQRFTSGSACPLTKCALPDLLLTAES